MKGNPISEQEMGFFIHRNGYMKFRTFSGFLVSVKLYFRDTLVFDATHQILQSIHHMGADIAADEHIHDVVTNAQFPFVQPDLDVKIPSNL